MRWFWIDRFIEFESGSRAVALKNVSMSEEHVEDYIPGFPMLASSLVVEGLAQTGGLLVGEHHHFKERVVLAKLGKAIFHCHAVPGDVLRYTAEIEKFHADGAVVRGTSHLGDVLQAEVEMIFAHLDERFDGVELFEDVEFLVMLRSFSLYDVGRTADGKTLFPPPHLLEAERAAASP